MVIRRSTAVDAPATARPPRPIVPEGSPTLVATSNSVRNLLLPKLTTIDGISLVGLADTPDNALKMLIQEHPDVVILDVDFGGPFEGLDIAKMMQKMWSQSAIVMVVSELDPVLLKKKARRYGTSWSYLKKTTMARGDILAVVLKSASRGVHWVEPELSRPLAELWKVAAQARDLESKQVEQNPVPVSIKSPPSPRLPETAESEDEDEEADVESEDEIAPGIELKSTNDPKADGLDITSVSVGRGGIGSGVGKVRRTG